MKILRLTIFPYKIVGQALVIEFPTDAYSIIACKYKETLTRVMKILLESNVTQLHEIKTNHVVDMHFTQVFVFRYYIFC